VRGISLFIVPRWRVNGDGSRGERNDVRLAGLNHKMGQRGSVNTFLKFGEAGRLPRPSWWASRIRAWATCST
jgi:alkylation response protein AidB-like acyl-CoA dehydrogenase